MKIIDLDLQRRRQRRATTSALLLSGMAFMRGGGAWRCVSQHAAIDRQARVRIPCALACKMHAHAHTPLAD